MNRLPGSDSARPTFSTVCVIANPVAGRGAGGRRLAQIESAVRGRLGDCSEVSLRRTEGHGHARRLAEQAVAQGADLVVAVGGDGTLHEVLNGVMGSPTTIGLIPMGTGNDFARAVGVPCAADAAVEVLVTGVAAPIDVGRCNGVSFLNVCGCGFDAVVAQRINTGYRRLRGTAAYTAAVIGTLARFRPTHLRVCVDDHELETEAMLCAVANGTSYGGGMRVAPDARVDDGLLDVTLVMACGKMEFIRAFPSVFRGTHRTHPRVRMFRGRSVTVASDPAVPLLIDGEVVGTTPAEFTIEPSRIRFMLPAGRPL